MIGKPSTGASIISICDNDNDNDNAGNGNDDADGNDNGKLA